MGKPIPSTGAHTGSRQESTTPSTPSSYSNTTYGSRPSVDGIDDQTTPAIYSSPRVVDWSDVEDHDTGETPFPSHRALWAEIEAVINTPIVNLRVRDRTGRRLSLAFDIGLYRSYEAMLKGPLPKVGHTIVVLIARKFPARVEDLLFRLIPMALDDLMALGHRVRFHIPEQNGPRVCYGCGLLSKSLSRCNHCQMFWHCNKECQAYGLKHRGHKDECRLLQDKALVRLLLLEQGVELGGFSAPNPPDDATSEYTLSP